MNFSRHLLRRLASPSVSNGSKTKPACCRAAAFATPIRGTVGLTARRSLVAFFCTGPSPDLPPLASNTLPGHRSFSSQSTLLDLLAREEQEEVDTGNTKAPEDLTDLRATIAESWKIVETGATTDLFRISAPSGKKIQVSFHCQDTLEVVGDEDDADDDGHDSGYDSEDEIDETSSPVRFTVTVSKAGKSLNFACFSEYGEVKIEGISTTAFSSVEHVHENQGQLPKTEYQGPDFNELAEDLQEALVVYLDEECGVNSDVAAFVAMASDFREELNYVDFLKQAQSIVS